MKVAVITSIYGDYDDLLEPPAQSIPTEFICVTDHPRESESWQIIVQKSELHPRLAAKRPKFMPDLYTDADICIWVDAAAKILTSTFAEDMIKELGDNDFAQFMHPARDCIYDEAEESKNLPKYRNQDIAGQIEGYRVADKFPEHWGLWATGVIVWRTVGGDIDVRRFGREWFRECRDTSYQDQLSEPVLLRAFDLCPKTIEAPDGTAANLWENKWVTWLARGERPTR